MEAIECDEMEDTKASERKVGPFRVVDQDRSYDLDSAYFGRPIKATTCYLGMSSSQDAKPLMKLIQATLPKVFPEEARRVSEPLFILGHLSMVEQILIVEGYYLWEDIASEKSTPPCT